MTKTIRILTLLALMVIGAGQAWAKTEPDLGKIVYTQTVNDHGTLSFYADETCQTAISNPGNGLNSSGLTRVEDGSNVIGYKVYIKATPDLEYTLGAADEGGKVTFIKAEVTVETNVAGARTRGTAPTVGVGDFLDVTATTTTGVYCMTMPADKNLNLLVTATFVVKPMNTAAISYIDADGETQSKAAGSVYILDGSETVLGKVGVETWYVCNTAATANNGKGLSYTSQFLLNGNVHLILADNCKMNVDMNTSAVAGQSSNFYIYGQSDGENSGKLIATNSSGSGITIFGNLYVNGGQVEATGSTGICFSEIGSLTINGGQVEATGTNGDGICFKGTSSVTINGGQVEANGTNGIYFTGTSSVTINGGQVEANGTNGDGICFTGTSRVTINGGQVEATGSTGFDIIGNITVSGGQVTATGTNGNGISRAGQGSVTITGGQVEATGSTGFYIIGDITVSGGQVTATGTDGDGISRAGQGSVTITGGQVEATGSDTHYGIFDATGDITLGWTDPSDYIKASSYSIPSGKSVKTTEGKRFVAYNMASESDISATAIVSGSSTDATPTFTLDAIAGKTLKPLDGNTVSTTGDITLTVGETAKTADFTITTGEGNEAITTYYYNIAANTTVTLGYYSNSELQLDYTAKKTSDNSNVTNTVISGSTLTMPAYDVTIGIRPFQVGVSYIDPTQTGDARNATTPAGTIVSVLDGTETSLNAGWYICNTPLNYNGLTLKGDVHLILADNGAMTFGTENNPISNYAISGKDYNLTIYGQSEGTGALSMYTTNSKNAIFAKGISICGGRVTAITKGTFGISTISSVNICGGEVTAEATNTNDTQNIRAIHSNGTVSISGGTVTVTAKSSNSRSADGIYGVQGVSISGGTVTANATGGYGRGIGSSGSNSLDYAISISGGKVTVCATGVSNSYGIYAMNNNIILGWTSADDYIYATSYSVTGSHSVKIAEGKHFVAYTPSGTPGTEGFDPSITGTTAIPFVSGSSEDSNPTFTLAGIAGKTLKPGTVTLNEGNGNGDVITLLEGETSITVASLTYNRTLDAPTESNKDVTIGTTPAKLYTTCLPTTPTTNDNVKYYTLASVSDNTLNFEEVTSPVADKPYLMAVIGNSNIPEQVTGSNVTLKKIVTGTPVDGYTMMGTQTGLTNSDAISAAGIADNATYILQPQSKWGKVTNKAGVYIPPFRAFIVGPAVNTGNAARQLNSSFDDDDATGIDSIRTIDSDGTERWYDLNGRRIDKPTSTQKGVYIQSGRKVVVK